REGDEDRTKVTTEALRYTFPQELQALLEHNGFEIRRRFGDWSLEPLTANSTDMIVVCRKRVEGA
ncbi:MAG: class I SAM-dependent methyltransferase, partial [Chloroflexota bacterium]